MPITLTVALIAAIFDAVRGGGGLSAVSTFDAVLAIGLPALIFLGGSYPLYSAAKKLYKSESALIGETAPEEYAGASVICFDDADAFPSYGVSLENLRIYGKGDIETIIEQMGAVFGKLGGPLRHVFSLMTTDCPRPYNTKIEGICEDGVCARVDGKTLFIGSASYMEANGLTVSDKSDELGGKRFSTMYLAQDGAHLRHLRIADGARAGLEDARLLARDLRERITKDLRVVEADVRDDGARRRGNDVRRVEPAAEADLQHHDIAPPPPEPQHGRRRHELELRRRVVHGGDTRLQRLTHGGKLRVGHRSAVDLHALSEAL